MAEIGAKLYAHPGLTVIDEPGEVRTHFDPEGTYVRRYVSELRRVPDKYPAEPWEMPDEVQRNAGCVIGDDYPEPMVDRREARERALERYRV